MLPGGHMKPRAQEPARTALHTLPRQAAAGEAAHREEVHGGGVDAGDGEEVHDIDGSWVQALLERDSVAPTIMQPQARGSNPRGTRTVRKCTAEASMSVTGERSMTMNWRGRPRAAAASAARASYLVSASLTGLTLAKNSGASMRSSSRPSTWRASGYCFTFLRTSMVPVVSS